MAGTILVMSLLLAATVTTLIYIHLNPDNRCQNGEAMAVSTLLGTEEVSYHKFGLDMIEITTLCHEPYTIANALINNYIHV